MASNKLPDATDSEFFENVISPLAEGKYSEALIFILDTPGSQPYIHYSSTASFDQDDLESAQDAVEFGSEMMGTLKALRNELENKGCD